MHVIRYQRRCAVVSHFFCLCSEQDLWLPRSSHQELYSGASEHTSTACNKEGSDEEEIGLSKSALLDMALPIKL
jgi:hypothetical protein